MEFPSGFQETARGSGFVSNPKASSKRVKAEPPFGFPKKERGLNTGSENFASPKAIREPSGLNAMLPKYRSTFALFVRRSGPFEEPPREPISTIVRSMTGREPK